MISGYTGEAFRTDIFIGPVYYQRLRHMVSDKFQVSTTAPLRAFINVFITDRRTYTLSQGVAEWWSAQLVTPGLLLSS